MRWKREAMAVFRHTTDLPEEARGGVVAIGNFDGVHRGHGAVFAEARERAARLNTVATVLTFEPHPGELFRPESTPFRLSSLRTKVRLLEDAGMAHLFVLQFDWAFARISADAFVDDIIAANLQARHVVTGRDFRFGHRRKGDASLMRIKAAQHGFGVSALDVCQRAAHACFSRGCPAPTFGFPLVTCLRPIGKAGTGKTVLGTG